MAEAIEIKKVWTTLLPEIAVPADRQWALWLVLHDPEIVRKGIAQLAAKYRKVQGAMDADYMVRFASSVMNRLSNESHHDVVPRKLEANLKCRRNDPTE